MGLNMLGVNVRDLMCEIDCGVMAWWTRKKASKKERLEWVILEISHFSSKYKKVWSAPIGHGATRKELIMWIASGRPIR